MIARNVKPEAVAEVVRYVSEMKYDGNLTLRHIDPQGKCSTRFTLRVTNSRGPGAKLGNPNFCHGYQRHTVAACWHAHYDVLDELFRRFPDTVVVTAKARYCGAGDFRAQAPSTQYQNVGSRMYPAYYGELCECA